MPCSPRTSGRWRSWRTADNRSPSGSGISGEKADSFLFLTSRGDQHASLRGLISTWLEIAVNALLSLDQDDGRRVWVILDELPTLHQVPSLQPGLAESRQFGGCFVLGVQVASALRDLYGRNGAENHLRAVAATRVVFAAPDRDTAQWSADSLGRSEIEEVAEGVSYGADPYRDGVTLTPKRELQSLALPSEITRLPNLTGYLKLPGPLPVARIELKYIKRPKIASRFRARTKKTQAAGPAAPAPESPDPNAAAQDAFVLEPPNLEPDAQDEPAPAMATTIGATDSTVTPEIQAELSFEDDETGNGAGDGKTIPPAEGKDEVPGTEGTDVPTGPKPDAEAGVAETERASPGSEAPETAQSKDRPKLGWTPI